MSEETAKRFRVSLREFDALLKRALGETYAGGASFDNESDFKFELYHNLHGLKLGGYELGLRLPGQPTCLLHAESRVVNEQAAKADLLICNPTRPRPSFNYRTEIVIELKKTLNAAALRAELAKFSGYGDSRIRRLYVIPANGIAPARDQVRGILTEHQGIAGKVHVCDRSTISQARHKGPGVDTPDGRSLLRIVRNCIEEALAMYGEGRHQYQGFYWRNYLHELGKGWTFPAEGDFNAQLYHLLRTRLAGWTIRTEYELGRTRSDFFISRPHSARSVGIEVKMNWDQFRHQPNKKKQEVPSIIDKFVDMESGRPGHTNILVVIQGEDAHRSNNKRDALTALAETRVPFHLLQYDERRGRVDTVRFRSGPGSRRRR